jgi:purine nucleosidase
VSPPLIIDTDPGIDDALAILLACASPELELQALTTVAGNVPLARVTENALKLLELGGKAEVPVYAGSDAPLARKPTVAQVHGTSGMERRPARATGKPQSGHAVDYLVETLSPPRRGMTTSAR